MVLHQVLAVAMVGAASGFGLYCLSCALHVWRSRHRNPGDLGLQAHRPIRWMRAIATVSFFGGIGCMVLTAAVELTLSNEGLLHGEGLFTVRPPKDLFVEWTTPKRSVEAGEVIARFGSPERYAEIGVVRLELDELRAKRAVLDRRPLEPDAEITRRLLETASDRRHLQATFDELDVEQRTVQRELSRERLAREHEINGLSVTVARLQRELDQSCSTLDFNEKQLNRSGQLLLTQATSQAAHEQWTRDLKLAGDEVNKLREQVANTAAQKAKLDQGLAEFTRVMEAQCASFGEQIGSLTTRLKRVASEEQALTERLEEDLARAAELRQRELQQIDVQLSQTEGKLAGLVGTLQEVAPFSGQFVYRAPSPRTAKEEEPLLVLGRQEGLRLRLRVPVWHKASMERATTVALELASPKNNIGKSKRHFVERRFTGRLFGWRKLPDDPWYGLAELACTPPPEAVWYLADGGEVLVSPRWWVWLIRNPGFGLGAILAALGVAGWYMTAAARRPARADRQGVVAEIETKAEGCLLGEYGAEGAMLHLLGTQLRDAIVRRQIDRHLIAAAEWALDRHRARAIRLISAGLHEDEGIFSDLRQLVEENRFAQLHGTNGVPPRGDLRRLLQVVQAIAGEELEKVVKRLLRELDSPALRADRPQRKSLLKIAQPR